MSDAEHPELHSESAKPAGSRETEITNPYATPLGEPSMEALESSRYAESGERVPWRGGWRAMTIIVAAVGVAIVTLSNYVHPSAGVLLLPMLGLATIAVIIRLLHTTVQVNWPIYLLVAIGFGMISYMAFIPVCMFVGLPVMIVLEGPLDGDLGPMIGIALTVITCGMLFTMLLRLYLKSKHRTWSPEAAMSSNEPQTFSGDPYADKGPKA